MPRSAHHWDSKRFFAYKNQFVKTQACKYYAAGVCKKGAECKFAHGTTELKVTPDLKKTAFCEDFKIGKCLLSSSECSYAHGAEDLRKGHAFLSMQKEKEGLTSRSDRSNSHPVQSALPGEQMLQPRGSEKQRMGQRLHQPLQNNGQQPVQGVDVTNAKCSVSACQQVPSTLESEMQLQVLLKSIRELMEGNPDFASGLAPPGLYTPSTTTAGTVTPMPMREDVFEPNTKLHGSPIYDDEPWVIPLPRFVQTSSLGPEHQPVWRL